MRTRTSAFLAIGAILWCSCANDEESHRYRAPAFVVDSMYARIKVIDDGRCNAPCSQADLFIKYMFEGAPGTINEIEFFPIGGRYRYATFLDYFQSKDANVWHTYSWRHILPDDFQGIDTCQVRITLEGAFWQVIDALNKYIVSYYGDFTFTDTLIVPIEKS